MDDYKQLAKELANDMSFRIKMQHFGMMDLVETFKEVEKQIDREKRECATDTCHHEAEPDDCYCLRCRDSSW